MQCVRCCSYVKSPYCMKEFIVAVSAPSRALSSAFHKQRQTETFCTANEQQIAGGCLRKYWEDHCGRPERFPARVQRARTFRSVDPPTTEPNPLQLTGGLRSRRRHRRPGDLSREFRRPLRRGRRRRGDPQGARGQRRLTAAGSGPVARQPIKGVVGNTGPCLESQGKKLSTRSYGLEMVSH